jgi:hypothetical protein
MNELSAEGWLAQEVDDLLDQGPVGLYQFIWGLRGQSFGLSDDEAIRLSIAVAERLVRAGRAALYAVSWPNMDVVAGPLPIETLRDPTSWSEGESGPLVALLPTA